MKPLFKITSDGTVNGTSIAHIETGVNIPCTRIQMDIKVTDGLINAIITVPNVELEICTQSKDIMNRIHNHEVLKQFPRQVN